MCLPGVHTGALEMQGSRETAAGEAVLSKPSQGRFQLAHGSSKQGWLQNSVPLETPWTLPTPLPLDQAFLPSSLMKQLPSATGSFLGKDQVLGVPRKVGGTPS